jgi:hypothetical protein
MISPAVRRTGERNRAWYWPIHVDYADDFAASKYRVYQLG